MTEILKPGSGLLFMKVGTHAQETLEDIITRKTQEIENAGYAMWGYGGNTCHPKTMVQPFAKRYARRGQRIHLCMQPMISRHFAEQVRADEFSADGDTWQTIPPEINVLGSRYALKIGSLRAEKFTFPLSATRVAIGNCAGRPGHQYIRGRVDKACLELTDEASGPDPEDRIIEIGLVAELLEPYAIFLRNVG